MRKSLSFKEFLVIMGVGMALSCVIPLVFTGCVNPLNPPDTPQPGAVSAAAGYGSVSVNFAGGEARTVFPAKVFTNSVYTFAKAGGSGQVKTPGADGKFALEPGQWTVEVKAYGGAVDDANLAATGASESFTVTDGEETLVTVALTGRTEEGAGTFKYAIAYPAGTAATVSLSKLPELETSVTLSASTTTTTRSGQAADVPAGFYLLSVQLTQDSGNSVKTAGKNEVVHIYNKLTSEFGTAEAPVTFTVTDFERPGLTGAAGVSGLPLEGLTLSVNTASLGGSGDLICQWNRHESAGGAGTPIAGATASTYQLAAADAGKYLSVTVGREGNLAGSSVSSDLVGPVVVPATLDAGVWADGNLAADGMQWFKFTATATGTGYQYLHASFGTLPDLYYRVYDSSGAAVGSETNLYSSITNTSRSVTSGAVYYVRVRPNSDYSGTYKILFNTSSTAPLLPEVLSAPELTENTWADGNLAADGTQWFKFTATESTQYLHASVGTLTRLYYRVYDSSGTAVGSESILNSNTTNISRSVTIGAVYYVRVRPYSSDYSGTYNILFNTSSTAPLSPAALSATELTANTWTDGNLAAGGTQWFKFIATDSTQYLHASFGTLNDLYYQLYDSSGATVATQANLSGSTTNISRSVTIGAVYYVRVRPYSSNLSGTYQIAFNTSSETTPLPAGTASATVLTENTWADGNLAAGGTQWFKFTATAGNQFLRASVGTLTRLYYQVYDSSGAAVGSESTLSASATYTYRSVTSGQVYYVRVRPYSSSGSGTYQILFNTATPTAPLPAAALSATELTANTWTNGSLAAGGTQWFKFTATQAQHMLHAAYGTLNDLYYEVYYSDGSEYNSATRIHGTSTFDVKNGYSSGSVYYVRVYPYSDTGSGTYEILFNTSTTPPLPAAALSAPALTANIWRGGSLAAGGMQWFKFTATVTGSQYLHASFGTLNDLDYQLYNSSGETEGDETNLWGTTTNINRSVTSGAVYYVRVRPHSGSGTGLYRIAFNASSTAPEETVAMVIVPGGSFSMGLASVATPVHSVTVSAFWMGKYEVTQDQYQAVIGSNPSQLSSDPASGEEQGKRPVERVNWYDALVFCNKLSMQEGLTPAYSISGSTDPAAWGTVPTTSNAAWNAATCDWSADGYRLPTEAEWEYAARGGNGSPGSYTWAGSNTSGDVAWHSGNAGSKSHEVGKKAANSLGLYDMSGNVAEWCWDWNGDYSSSAATDPVGPASGTVRDRRGGAYSNAEGNTRSAVRLNADPSRRSVDTGLRLVRRP